MYAMHQFYFLKVKEKTGIEETDITKRSWSGGVAIPRC